MFASFEGLLDGSIVVHENIGEVNRDSPDDRQAPLRGVGNARKRVDRRNLDRKIEPSNACDLGSENEQIGWEWQRRKGPGKQQGEREPSWRVIVVVQLHYFVLEAEKRPRVYIE